MRLARWLGTSATVWLNPQQAYDLEVAEIESGTAIEREATPRSLAARGADQRHGICNDPDVNDPKASHGPEGPKEPAMSDPSVDREMEANQQRANNTDNDNDDGSVVDSLEQTVNPLTRGIDLGGDSTDGDGGMDPDQQRRLNDAEQRPS